MKMIANKESKFWFLDKIVDKFKNDIDGLKNDFEIIYICELLKFQNQTKLIFI